MKNDEVTQEHIFERAPDEENGGADFGYDSDFDMTQPEVSYWYNSVSSAPNIINHFETYLVCRSL